VHNTYTNVCLWAQDSGEDDDDDDDDDDDGGSGKGVVNRDGFWLTGGEIFGDRIRR